MTMSSFILSDSFAGLSSFIINLTYEWDFNYTLAFIIFAPLLQEKPEIITVKYIKDKKPSFEIPSPFLPNNFSPWFVTGYADAESCFFIHIIKHKNKTTGYAVQLRFIIVNNGVVFSLLYLIKKFFGCGVISPVNSNDVISFTVSDINSIINIMTPLPPEGGFHLEGPNI